LWRASSNVGRMIAHQVGTVSAAGRPLEETAWHRVL
jgi:hypothetical protein